MTMALSTILTFLVLTANNVPIANAGGFDPMGYEEVDPTFRGYIKFVECEEQHQTICSIDNGLWCTPGSNQLRAWATGQSIGGNRLFVNLSESFACWNVKNSDCRIPLKMSFWRSQIMSTFDEGFVDFELEDGAATPQCKQLFPLTCGRVPGGRDRFRLDVLWPFSLENAKVYLTHLYFPDSPKQPSLQIFHGECRILPFMEGSQNK